MAPSYLVRVFIQLSHISNNTDSEGITDSQEFMYKAVNEQAYAAAECILWLYLHIFKPSKTGLESDKKELQIFVNTPVLLFYLFVP